MTWMIGSRQILPLLKENSARGWGERPLLFDRRSHGGGYAPHEVKDHGYYGKNQKNVDEESCDMKDEKSA
jgi:hypothetical protein